MKKESITIMVPAYNEEKHLRDTVIQLDGILKDMFMEYEILILDDGSSDKTGEIADLLEKENPRIRAVHNKINMGLGYSHRRALQLAKFKYFGFIPGDGVVQPDSIRKILELVGTADIIIPYTANTKVRPLFRRIISNSFTNMLNTIFGLNLKYYNGVVVHKVELTRKVKMTANGLAYQAELLINLLKQGHSYKEVPMYLNIEEASSFRLRHSVDAAITTVKLFFKLNFRGNKND